MTLAFWKHQRSYYPRLSEIATKVLCIPASQSTSERQFCIMRSMFTHLRGALDPEKANMVLTCAACNRSRDLLHLESKSKPRSQRSIESDPVRQESRTASLRAKQKSRAGDYHLSLLLAGETEAPTEVLGDEWMSNIEMLDDGERSDDPDYSEQCMSEDDDVFKPPSSRKSRKFNDSSTVTSSPPQETICRLTAPAGSSIMVGILETTNIPLLLGKPSSVTTSNTLKTSNGNNLI
jgi:hypothetical protein